MRRNLTAAALQAVGIAAVVVAAFVWNLVAGFAALGVAFTLVGLALEGDR